MTFIMDKGCNHLLALAAFLTTVHLSPAWPRKSDCREERELKLQNFRLQPPGPQLRFTIESLGKPGLEGTFGVGIPQSIGPPSGTCDAGSFGDHCVEYGDYGKFYYSSPKESNNYCARIEWNSSYARRLEDCFDLADGVHWYGGGGPTYTHTWPIQTISRQESPFVSGDFIETKSEEMYGGVSENYWLLTSGVALHVDEDVPLRLSINSTRKNQICIVAEDRWPYKHQGSVSLKYDLCVGKEDESFKDVHQRALAKFYKQPLAIPDERMLVEPIWSTWATYKTHVNQSVVLDLAQRLIQEGFRNSSHIEIDDHWETCYGDHVFGPKFPDPSGMTAKLRALGLRSSVWIHPFIHIDCPAFQEAYEAGFLVKDERSHTALTAWWHGDKATILDFSNKEAVQWWSSKMEKLRSDHGIDAFKFDAGESAFLPPSAKLSINYTNPTVFTTKYVQVAAKFGAMTEVRVGRGTQNETIFVRMLDKGSTWEYQNGLKSMIPSLLDFGLKGYSYVLPDMVGGNYYGEERASKELFIRWLQVSALMPSIQFSMPPWDYDEETVRITREILDLRFTFKQEILRAAEQTVIDGTPINRPLWWTDPTDKVTYTIDDEYMLGDDVLVTPVTTEGARSRDIYLPKGKWRIVTGENTGQAFTGPLKVSNFSVPLHMLPVFVEQSSNVR